MKLKENAFTRLFGSYVRSHNSMFPHPFVFEAKLVKKPPYKYRIKQENPGRREHFEEQIKRLLVFERDGMFYKPRDGKKHGANPGDGIWIPRKCPTFIVIFFWEKRKAKNFVMIQTSEYLRMERELKNQKKTTISRQDLLSYSYIHDML